MLLSTSLQAQRTLYDLPYSLAEINQSDSLGKKQGRWYIFDKNTKIIYEMINYVNDILQGNFEYYWYTTGSVASKGYYKNGKVDGLHVAYWENGQERGRAYYKDGILNGIAITHDKSGNLTSRIRYINGKQDSSYAKQYIDPNIIWDNDHPVKMDTIYSSWLQNKNERYAIYRNDTLIHMYNIKDGQKINESFYEKAEEVKRIIYCDKSPYDIRKIFYYDKGKLIRTELIDDNCKKKSEKHKGKF